MNAPPEPPIAARESETVSGEPRISTGNPELDTILRGGLVARRPYLVVGPAGTGKTKLVLQFLCEGVRRGERVMLITLEDPPNEMRINHRALVPELDQVYVFDAIPDVMRYERAPFKDIAAVRSSVPFSEVPPTIRKTAELVSVEVTFSALEQTLKMEMAKRSFTRLAVDSLTALQYFCMKGIDETLGAQTFLRFLSDLRVTTLLTVEAPVEDVETAERLLARGEVRLFRWELDGLTVRAIGVEKFRGSAHDVRLHPYRISSRGLDIDLKTTISRDTRRVVDPAGDVMVPPGPEGLSARPNEVGQILADLRDLAAVGIDVASVQGELARLKEAADARKGDEVALHLIRARALVSELATQWNPRGGLPSTGPTSPEEVRVVRIADQAGAMRVGAPPTELVLPPSPPSGPVGLDRWSGEGGASAPPGSDRGTPSETPTPAPALPASPVEIPPAAEPEAPTRAPDVPPEAPPASEPIEPVPDRASLDAANLPPAPDLTTEAVRSEGTSKAPPSAPEPSRLRSPRVPAPPLPGGTSHVPAPPPPREAAPAPAPSPAPAASENVVETRPSAKLRARPPLPDVPRAGQSAPPEMPPQAPAPTPAVAPRAPTPAPAPRTRSGTGRGRSRGAPATPSQSAPTASHVLDLAGGVPSSPAAPTAAVGDVGEPARPAPRRRRAKAAPDAGAAPPIRRRTASRRKAPPVTHADPGTPPPEGQPDPTPAPPTPNDAELPPATPVDGSDAGSQESP